MALTPDTRLGPYEITAAIGAGGMGQVYRARDTRLNRDVAIKVLPTSFADDPDRRARFEREAQAVAALSHPNVIAIFDTGVHDGQLYVVMELLDGGTLGERLTAGALPVRKAVDIAVQVARGLGAAHSKGIVHRDLKPDNIFLLDDGQVKILDFGLARQVAADRSGATRTMAATDPGTVMGTVGYMAPEQLRGQAVDARADVFAFGAVIYEMVGGQRAFQRDTAADTVTAILTQDPPELTGSRPDLSPELVRIIGHCLEKNANERFQSARDIAFALDALSGRASSSQASMPAAAPAVSGGRRLQLAWGLAAAALLLAGAAVWWASRPPAQDVWTGVRLGGAAQAFGVRLSPDGQLLAFLAFVDHKPQLAVMKPDGGSWTVLTHEREGYVATASWAPDGSCIYFDRVWGHPLGVYSVPPLGGEPRPLVEDAFGPEPLRDGSLIILKVTDRGDDQLFHYWPDSGRLEALPAFLKQTDVTPMLRAFPDGQEIVFRGMSEAGRSRAQQMLIYNLTSRTTRELSSEVHFGSTSSWSPLDVSADGQSVYLLSEAANTWLLLEVPRRGGRPRVLLTFPQTAVPVSLDAARDGSLYLDQRILSPAVLQTALAGGAPEEFSVPPGYSNLIAVPGDEVFMDTSTAGRRQLIAWRPGGELRVPVNTTEETMLPATVLGGNLAFMVGSGDTRQLALASLRDGRILRRYSAKSDGGLSASPDGQTLYYSSAGAIWAQPVTGGDPTRITVGEDVVLDPAGQHLYIRRAHGGANEIVRMSVRGSEAEVLPVPPDYHVAIVPLSPVAVDGRGRILITVASKESFYYQTALLDPLTKSFSLVPVAFEGDVNGAGWTADGRILVAGERYPLSLWRYQRATGVK